MRKFKILGIVAILVIFTDIVLYFVGNWNDISGSFMDGWNSVDRETMLPPNTSPVTLNVYQTEQVATDSIMNKELGKSMPYTISQIQTRYQTPMWQSLCLLPLLLVCLAFFIGFFQLIALLIAIAKKDIFNPLNIARIRWFAYSLFAYALTGSIFEWVVDRTAISQIDLPGYEFINSYTFTGEWSMVITIVLFAEIFAQAVKIKEEQDLTI